MSFSIKEDLNILVLGDLMIDHYIYGTCNRISPEAPVPIVEVSQEYFTLGGAGNVLKNLVALGCKANIVSVMGDDDNAAIVLSELAFYNISGDGVMKASNRCTTIKSRVMVTNHQMIRLDREVVNPLNNDTEQQILSYFNGIVSQYDIVLLSDYNKGLLSASLLKAVIDVCRFNQIHTIVDPKGLDFSKYYGVNTIKPNKKEAAMATGISIKSRDDLEQACKKIKMITGCDNVIITMSEEGIAYYAEGKLSIIPTKALEIVDVTGAGDTVLASLGVAIASGNSLVNSCGFANHAAAVVVSKVGSAIATISEINKLISAQ